MTAAATISVTLETSTKTREVIAHYSWTQYQLTSTIDGETSTAALAAMTREDAVAYAKEARKCLQYHCEGFTGMKLSMVACAYSESLTAHADTHEDGDGSPYIREQRVSGEKWSTRRRGKRNFRLEAIDARDGCKALQDYFYSVGC